MAYSLPNIQEDNDLFERLFSFLPNGPNKTPLEPAKPHRPTSTKNETDPQKDDNSTVSLEVKLQNKIASLQSQRGTLDKGAIRERRRIKKQEKKLQDKKKALSVKKDTRCKDEDSKLKKNKESSENAETEQFLFGGLKTDSNSKKKRKTITGLHGKNYKQLLDKVERSHKEVEKMEAEDATAAEALKKEAKFKAALDRAMGEKIKDDPKLLEKALRKKEKLKRKRKEAWEERQENVEKKMKGKQNRRDRNLQKRKDDNKETKLKKALKKGRIIPGVSQKKK